MKWWRRWRERLRLRLRRPIGLVCWTTQDPENFVAHRERLHVTLDVPKELLQSGHPAVADLLAYDAYKRVHRLVMERVG